MWHESREVHVESFKEICSIVEESIIEKSEVSFLTDLTSLYRSILVDKGIDEDILFTCQHLQDKLARHFAGRILFDNGNKKRGNVVFRAGMDIDQAVRAAFDLKREAMLYLELEWI